MEREGVWERRGERGGRAQIWEVGVGRWRDGALEEWSSGGASERRGVRGWGGGHSAWTMDEQRWGERERESLLKCWSFSLSFSFSPLRFSPFSWEHPPPLILLLPPSFSKAPLVHTLHLPPPSSSSFSSSSCLSLRPPACRLSIPGGSGSAGGTAVICRRFV